MKAPAWHTVKPIRGGVPLSGLFLRLMDSPLWMSQAKLDGQRAIWDGHYLWTRGGNRIQDPKLLDALGPISVVLDGEYLPTKGAKGGAYYPFDVPAHTGCLSQRWKYLADLLEPVARAGLLSVCPAGVTWHDVESHGWEGVVFKLRLSTYPKALSAGSTTADWVKYRAAWLSPHQQQGSQT